MMRSPITDISTRPGSMPISVPTRKIDEADAARAGREVDKVNGAIGSRRKVTTASRPRLRTPRRPCRQRSAQHAIERLAAEQAAEEGT